MKALLLGGVFAIALATLWPFAFAFHSLSWAEYAGRFGLAPRTLLDWPRNVVLFIPFGSGLAASIVRQCHSGRATLAYAFLAGLLITASVESLQVFLPGRTPNVSDMIGNSFGAVTGGAGFLAWQRPLAWSRMLGRGSGALRSVVTFAVYLLLMVLLSWGLMRGMRPEGWEAPSRVVVGGTVHDLLILNRLADHRDTAELLDSRVVPWTLRDPVAGNDPHSGQFGLTSLADCVNESKEFTVVFTPTPGDVKERNEAAILTVLGGAFQTNLVLGQDQSRLTVRWRSALTDANGVGPAVEFPGVFSSPEPRRLVISVDGMTARVRAADSSGDDVVYLGPEIVFSAILFETNLWPLTPDQFGWWKSVLPLSALIFFPLGLLLFSVVGVASHHSGRLGLIMGGLLLPPLVTEGFVASYVGRHLRLEILALGVGLMSLGLILRLILGRPFQQQRLLEA